MKKNKKIVALIALVMMTCVSQSVVLNAQEEPIEKVAEVETTKEQESEMQETVASVNPNMEEKGVMKVSAETRGSDVSTLAEGDLEINEENFPDAEFRKYLISQNVGSTTLTASKINNTKIISVSYKNTIQSLKGIEYFPNLTSLSCDTNQLTSLDVSKNTALTYLSCSNNQLENLDVSKNTALENLVFSSNKIKSIDISKNTALTYVACSSNRLTSLDVSKNKELTKLLCNGNQLINLDVSKNTALKTLNCYANQLTSLDISNTTNLSFKGYSQKRSIGIGNDGTFELSTLSSNIDTSKISSLKNATLNGTVLSDLKTGTSVTYNYDCGNGKTIDVTLEVKLKAPAIVEPSAFAAKEGTKLSEITLPTGWTWVDPNTVLDTTKKSINSYPARFAVDDVTYHYNTVVGYNAAGHYVERNLNINVIQNPVVNPDGSTTIFPGDTIITPDGSMDFPNGGTIQPDGSITVNPGGSITTPDGTITLPEGGTIKPDGSIVVKPGGSIVTPDETITFPNGGSLNADGTITKTEDPNKPSVGNSGSSTGSNTDVNTGDQSNQKGLLVLLGMSSFMILNLLKKRNKSVEENR